MLATIDQCITFCGVDEDPGNVIAAMLLPSADRILKEYLGFDPEYGTHTEYLPPTQAHAPIDVLVEGYEMWGQKAVPLQRFADDRRILQLTKLPVRQIFGLDSNNVQLGLWENYSAWDNGPPGEWPDDDLLSPPDIVLDSSTDNGATTIDTYVGFSTSGFVFRRSGIWSNIERTIKAVYVGGLQPSELDITTGRYPEFTRAVLITVQVWFNEWKNWVGKSGMVAGAITSESLDGYSVSVNPEIAKMLGGYMTRIPVAAARQVEKWQRQGQFMGGN